MDELKKYLLNQRTASELEGKTVKQNERRTVSAWNSRTARRSLSKRTGQNLEGSLCLFTSLINAVEKSVENLLQYRLLLINKVVLGCRLYLRYCRLQLLKTGQLYYSSLLFFGG
jgi:hypothetical protein